MSPIQRLVFVIVWACALAGLGWVVNHHLSVSGDLRRFMPEARTPDQKLLMNELGDGPGSRLLLVAIEGADTATLAQQSQQLKEALSKDDQFELINNGEQTLESIPENLLPYRYLLSRTFDQNNAFTAAWLKDEFQQRIQDLGSPAAELVEPLLASDPTLEVLKIAESLQPQQMPQLIDGVWFDKQGKRALLVVLTKSAGFDPTGQLNAVNAIKTTFADIKGQTSTRMIMTGAGAFSVEIGGRTEAEGRMIGTFDTIGLILLLLIAYRSWKIPVLGVLPLATAGLAGLSMVALLFDSVHGITIAFGFTLIGVVQDYPIHLFSHQRPGISPVQNAKHLWPALSTGVMSTCIAYLTFLFSGVDGLRQLAVFTITALAMAALTTRFILPYLLGDTTRDYADVSLLQVIWKKIQRLPHIRYGWWAVLAVLCIGSLIMTHNNFWQNDLSKLTPVPADLLQQDMELRSEIGVPDVRYMLVIQAATTEEVLRKTEQLEAGLNTLVERNVISGFDMASRYLPSVHQQKQRQQQLPQRAALDAMLTEALQGSEFREDAFTEFADDVQTAKSLPGLTLPDLVGTPLQNSVKSLLIESEGKPSGLVSLSGLENVAAVHDFARQHGIQLLDMKQASESLVVEYRSRILWSLLIASLLLIAVVWFALKEIDRVVRVLLPMALTTLIILAVHRLFGVEMTLFHLIALILAAGLGLDYALFFDHAGDDYRSQLRTLHGLIVCSLMTLIVFMLLAFSSIPVLRAIGTTVTLGVIGNFVLGLLISRQPVRDETHVHS